MSWIDLPTPWRTTAESVCTPLELDTLKLRAAGMSWNQIANWSGRSRGAVQSRHRNALRKIHSHLEEDTLDATPL